MDMQIGRSRIGEESLDRSFEIAAFNHFPATIIASASKARTARVRERSCSGTSSIASNLSSPLRT
jgi:hypothetical protein